MCARDIKIKREKRKCSPMKLSRQDGGRRSVLR